MIELLVNVLRASAVLSALLLVAAANAKRPRRVEQTWMPVIACAYACIALIAVYLVPERIEGAVKDLLQSAVTAVASAGRYAPGLGAWLGSLDSNLQQLVNSFLSYLLLNIAIVLPFAILKRATRPVFGRYFQDGKRGAQFIAADIYRMDPDSGLWFVEPRFRRVRDLYRVLYWTSVALALALIALALTYSGWPGFSTVAYPAVAALVIGEFFFAVDGLTRAEYESEFAAEIDKARRVGNFGPLRGVFRREFPGETLTDGAIPASNAALDSGFRISEMMRSEDPSVRLAGDYFNRLRDSRIDIDINNVNAAAHLLAGRNVLFANPFYTDLTPYLCLPAYKELLERRKVLIIGCQRNSADSLVNWMDQGLRDITGVASLWAVGQLKAATLEELDVGVLSMADLYDRDLLVNNGQFLASVGMIIFTEPSLIMSTGQVGVEFVLDRCKRDGHIPVVAALDTNHDGLVDTLSHLTKGEFIEVVASELPMGACSEVVWRPESFHAGGTLVPGVLRYLGIGTEVATVALKYDVDKIHWVGADVFPVSDMSWIAQQYFAPINELADTDVSQDVIAERLIPLADPWGLPQNSNYFLIVEDFRRNMYESVRQFATRATRSGFVNLISDEYLLRDYFVDNRDAFLTDPKAIPALVPDYTRTDRNVILRMMLMLSSFGMSQPEIEAELSILEWDDDLLSGELKDDGLADREPHSITKLRAGIRMYTGLDDVSLVAKTVGHFLDEPITTYELKETSATRQVMRELAPAYFLAEDDAEGRNVIGSLQLGHVYQTLLPGQFVTYSGKHYEVHAISSDAKRGRVVLRRAADHIRDRRTYRHLRHFTLKDMHLAAGAPTKRVMGEMKLQRAVATIWADSLGYVESITRSDLGQLRRVEIDGIPTREYHRKSLTVVHLPGASDDVRSTIAVLLNEVFVTMFPDTNQYICAVTPGTPHEAQYLVPSVEILTDGWGSDDWGSSLFIVEDSLLDLGLTSAVERNWERIVETISDYLDWVQSPWPVVTEATDSPPSELFPDRPDTAESDPPKSWIARLFTWLRHRFTRKPREPKASGERDSPTMATDPSDGDSGAEESAGGAPQGEEDTVDEAQEGPPSGAESPPSGANAGQRPVDEQRDGAGDGTE